MYQMVAQQLYNSRQRYIKDNKHNKVPDHGILVGDLVLVKDHTAKLFEPKYKEDYRVVQIYGTNALQVSDKRGKLHNVHITDVRRINMTEKVQSPIMQRAFFFNYYYANSLFFCKRPFVCKLLFLVFMQDAPCLVCWFSRSFVSEACACFWGMFCERLCASRSLLGSYVHQESI